MRLARPDEVTPAIAAIFEDAKDALGIPWVPEEIRALATFPVYLELVWPQLRPNLDQAGFAFSAAFIADRALDFARSFYEPTYTPDDIAAAIGADRSVLRQTLRALHYGAPQVMLIAGALLEALKFDAAGGKGRAGERDAEHSERMMRRAPVVVTEEEDATDDVAAVYRAVRSVTTLPYVPIEFRVIARWPAYLRMAWDDLEHVIPHPEYRMRRRSLSYYSAGGTHYFTHPVRLGRPALREAGMSDEAIAALQATLEVFATSTPAQLLHTVALEHAFNPREVEVER